MNRYILLYQGKDSPTDTEIAHVRTLPGLKLIAEDMPRMLLVEATNAAVQKLQKLPSWRITPETFVPLPDTRKKAKLP